jgi:hypothetical protein
MYTQIMMWQLALLFLLKVKFFKKATDKRAQNINQITT